MNKAQMIETLVDRTGKSAVIVETILNAFMEETKRAVKKNDDVKLIGFGTFTKMKRKARNGRNPQTGEQIKLSARNTVKFRAGQQFKDLVK